MTRPVLLTLVILFGILLLALMVWGWLRLRRRQTSVIAPPAVPADLGEALGVWEALYLATTAADNALQRIAVHGLGFRGTGSLAVYPTGVLLQRAGEHDLWIPREAITDIRTATWTIDRSVEPGGLDLVAWTLGERTVDSYFRLRDPKDFQSVAGTLLDPSRSTT